MYEGASHHSTIYSLCLSFLYLSLFLPLSLFIVIKLKVGFEREAHVLWTDCDSSIYFRHKEEKGVGRENRGCVAGVEEGEDVKGRGGVGGRKARAQMRKM